MTHEWGKQISKAADLLVTIPVGTDYWGKEQHEPLRLGVCFPFAKVAPWQLKGSKGMVDLGKTLSQMWKDGEGAEGDLLFEFCDFAWRMEDMQVCDLRKVLFGQSYTSIPHLQGGRDESSTLGKES